MSEDYTRKECDGYHVDYARMNRMYPLNTMPAIRKMLLEKKEE